MRSDTISAMQRSVTLLIFLLSPLALSAHDEKKPAYPSFDYDAARTHEIKPHRRTIPTEGVGSGFNQLHLKLIVSLAGEVTHSEASGNPPEMEHWPEIQSEAAGWKFTPFEKDGKAVTAEVEEYIDLVPPERLPKTHLKPPEIRPDSIVSITLQRSGCMGSCPSYSVTIATTGIFFKGGGNVVAQGKHRDTVNPAEVRDLGRRFVNADFYSMNSEYSASVTDCPTYVLSITIDGQSKKILDYVGQWEGMPAVIADLEDEVDDFAQTKRWIEGADGLVDALKAEKFNFKSYDAQIMLKAAAQRGQADTVQDLLDIGVPLKPYPAPKPKSEYERPVYEHVGWLNAASRSSETLKVLIDAGASEHDQSDKNLALLSAAETGKIDSIRALIDYGADPNADFSKQTITRESGGMIMENTGGSSVLISAAASGNPDMLREVLRYNPKLDVRDYEGKTALFAAGDYRDTDVDGARAECVRLLIQAGANVNAHDKNGNTPLHETFLTEVEEELIKLGADVNARNKDGETPIFTTVDNSALSLYIEHGADLSIRNNKGQTVVEAAPERGQQRVEALSKAIDEHGQKMTEK
jgi:ankyrin repeat protein